MGVPDPPDSLPLPLPTPTRCRLSCGLHWSVWSLRLWKYTSTRFPWSPLIPSVLPASLLELPDRLLELNQAGSGLSCATQNPPGDTRQAPRTSLVSQKAYAVTQWAPSFALTPPLFLPLSSPGSDWVSLDPAGMWKRIFTTGDEERTWRPKMTGRILRPLRSRSGWIGASTVRGPYEALTADSRIPAPAPVM